MEYRGLIELPPNRVRRSYRGGRTLDLIAGAAVPGDSLLAEDWVASTTRSAAIDSAVPDEGISIVRVGGREVPLPDLLASDADYYLGAAHVERHGMTPQLLVKYLDSATRLHFQVHPTREFAQGRLGMPSGKTEAYHVLAVRPDLPEPAYILAGFQRAPTRAELRRMIEEQDVVAMEACFDRILVEPGDTYLIPAGTPHALGPGIFMVEVQEPSDLVVRFEFARDGYVLPEAARFMGRDLDLALDVFDLREVTLAEVNRRLRCHGRVVCRWAEHTWQEEIIGPAEVNCFRVIRTVIGGVMEKSEETFAIVFVTQGAVTVEAAGKRHRFERYDKFFVPAGIGPVRVIPDERAELLECYPPPGK